MSSSSTPQEYSDKTRAQWLSALPGSTVDTLIIGGGIVGAGLLRELAIRGISGLLVEKSDFASGTSSRSSKLIHGGLRYLEMYDFHLVFEALAERHWLLQTHPHLVQPLEFNLPIYRKDDAPPGARSSTLLGLGLWLYDGLSLFRTPFFHGKHKPEEMKKLFPGIRNQGLKGSYFYADAMMLDDELVLETVSDAVRRGARALNYVKALEVGERDSTGYYNVKLHDELAPANAPIHVRAKEVVVCVGPWTEVFGEKVASGSKKKLKPSKGVHLIVPWERFPIERCLVMYSPDGRIVFAIPRKDLGADAEMVIIGTTDSPASRMELDHVAANKGDVEYLLKVMSEYFPGREIRKEDIVMTYAGVRPLLDSGSESEAKTSREHEIWRNDAGVIFMAGGKYTTFRKISQELADFTYPGTKSRAFEQNSKEVLSSPEQYAARFTGAPLWGKFTEGWVRWKLKHHVPCTLEDLVFRRMPLWMAGESLSPKVLERIADIAADYWGWDAEKKKSELSRVHAGLEAGQAWRS